MTKTKLRLVREERGLLERSLAWLESHVPPPHESPIFSTTNLADVLGLQLVFSGGGIPFYVRNDQVGGLFPNTPWCPWELVVPASYRMEGMELVRLYEQARMKPLYLVKDQ